MAVICIAGTSQGIGKTAVAELLLSHLPGWSVARVRVADEISPSDAAILGDAAHRLIPAATVEADAEMARLLAAGARDAAILLAQPRGLADGLAALIARLPRGTNVLVEGNAYLWAAAADVSVMVIGPGPSGKGLGRVRQSARELFPKVNIWAWNTRAESGNESFFDFPQDLARMGFHETVSNRADYHHVNPRDGRHSGNVPFVEAVRKQLERGHWRRGSDEFLRKAGFDV